MLARSLIVVADDLGIGPETTEGILDLACRGVVTATVLLANSPHAEHGVARWRARGMPCDLGWHPCLTLDEPVCRPREVPSLVDADGRMGPLSRFLLRLATGQIRAIDIRRELTAQYRRFLDLAGQEPDLVNAHHHVAVFPPVGAILRGILAPCRPWLRRVRESWATWRNIGGARLKRALLCTLGTLQARHQGREGFPGADALAGIGNPCDEGFFTNWIRRANGVSVELMCHPGRYDTTLLGRDAEPGDGSLESRVLELRLLAVPAFADEARRAGFRLERPSGLARHAGSARHAA